MSIRRRRAGRVIDTWVPACSAATPAGVGAGHVAVSLAGGVRLSAGGAAGRRVVLEVGAVGGADVGARAFAFRIGLYAAAAEDECRAHRDEQAQDCTDGPGPCASRSDVHLHLLWLVGTQVSRVIRRAEAMDTSASIARPVEASVLRRPCRRAS